MRQYVNNCAIMRVLVIGASFSGLTTANRLLQLEGMDEHELDASQTDKRQYAGNNTGSDNSIEVDVVDALRPPSDDSVFVGDITVPAAPLVLAKLGLLPISGMSKNQSDNTIAEGSLPAKFKNANNCDCDVSRQELLDCLRRRVTVHYRHVVQELWVDKIKEGVTATATDSCCREGNQRSTATTLLCWAQVQVQEQTRTKNINDDDDDDKSGELNTGRPKIIQKKMGPYDAVIVATGTRSQFPVRIRHPSSWPWMRPETTVILTTVGDARYTRWWDFGQHRIRQGANQALVDGLELGNAMLHAALEQQQQDCYMGGLDRTLLMRNIPGKFRLPQTRMLSVLLYFLGILLAIYAAKQDNAEPGE